MKKRFVIRVYGMLLSPRNEILIAEEFHYNTFMRKFPGGGLEFGEGPLDCLRRELMEELQYEPENFKPVHLHTTDFFAPSAFNGDIQVVGIYYLLPDTPLQLCERFREDYLLPEENGTERFRWADIDKLSSEEITFPTDRKALELLKNLRRS